MGFAIGLLSTLLHSVQLRKFNETGVVSSLGSFGRYLIPGLFAGVLSAILSAVNQGNNGNYVLGRLSDRNHMGQGGYQMIGVAFSVAFGLAAGVLLGILFKLVNRNGAH